MLTAPPPGYSPQQVNNQNVGSYNNVPGRQGGISQGYLNPTTSSYAQPSSAAFPSSLPHPAGAPGGDLAAGMTVAQAVQALNAKQQPPQQQMVS